MTSEKKALTKGAVVTVNCPDGTFKPGERFEVLGFGQIKAQLKSLSTGKKWSVDIKIINL